MKKIFVISMLLLSSVLHAETIIPINLNIVNNDKAKLNFTGIMSDTTPKIGASLAKIQLNYQMSNKVSLTGGYEYIFGKRLNMNTLLAIKPFANTTMSFGYVDTEKGKTTSLLLEHNAELSKWATAKLSFSQINKVSTTNVSLNATPNKNLAFTGNFTSTKDKKTTDLVVTANLSKKINMREQVKIENNKTTNIFNLNALLSSKFTLNSEIINTNDFNSSTFNLVGNPFKNFAFQQQFKTVNGKNFTDFKMQYMPLKGIDLNAQMKSGEGNKVSIINVSATPMKDMKVDINMSNINGAESQSYKISAIPMKDVKIDINNTSINGQSSESYKITAIPMKDMRIDINNTSINGIDTQSYKITAKPMSNLKIDADYVDLGAGVPVFKSHVEYQPHKMLCLTGNIANQDKEINSVLKPTDKINIMANYKNDKIDKWSCSYIFAKNSSVSLLRVFAFNQWTNMWQLSYKKNAIKDFALDFSISMQQINLKPDVKASINLQAKW